MAGIFSGSMSYVRFVVEGQTASPFLESYEKSITMRRFVPLHPQGEDLESFGWAPAQRPYDDQMDLTNDLFMFGTALVMAYREDSISFPKPMVKDLVAAKMAEYAAEKGTHPSSSVKTSIEAAVKSELRRKLLPKSRVVDLAWDTNTGQVRFFARSIGLCERFAKLFEQTFSLKLRAVSYGAKSVSADLSSQDRAILEQLEPQAIFAHRSNEMVH